MTRGTINTIAFISVVLLLALIASVQKCDKDTPTDAIADVMEVSAHDVSDFEDQELEYSNLLSKRQGYSDEVAALQNFLILERYDLGPTGIDGIVGPYTLTAVDDYIIDNNTTLVELFLLTK